MSPHHRRSIRLPGYDYSAAGNYFVTLCTHERQHLFGSVVDGKVRLNAVGAKVQEGWRAIPEYFPHVALDAFVIMPNHVHGIVGIRADIICPHGEMIFLRFPPAFRG